MVYIEPLYDILNYRHGFGITKDRDPGLFTVINLLRDKLNKLIEAHYELTFSHDGLVDAHNELIGAHNELMGEHNALKNRIFPYAHVAGGNRRTLKKRKMKRHRRKKRKTRYKK